MTSNSSNEKGSSLWQDAWYRLKKNKAALLGLSFLILISACCFLIPIVGDLTAPEDDQQRATEHWYKNFKAIDLTNTFAESSSQNLLGTDQAGRDVLARVLFGGQISIIVGLLATFISVCIGVTYGAISGYVGGKTDSIMMRIVDILFGLPMLVLIVLFTIVIADNAKEVETYMKQKEYHVTLITTVVNIIPLCIAIGSLGWFTMARIVRAQTMSTRKLEYVEAARSLGLSHFKILFKHILPNISGTIIVYISLTLPVFILTEATLSFLGLGVKAQTTWKHNLDYLLYQLYFSPLHF